VHQLFLSLGANLSLSTKEKGGWHKRHSVADSAELGIQLEKEKKRIPRKKKGI